jgi:ubiquinone/menaquinone biosynthesis C-methylase UbiE
MIDDNILDPGQFYDEMAPHYDEFISNTRFSFLPPEAEKQFLEAVLSNRQSILDLGCGTGRTIQLLNSKGRNLIGIDIAPQMLRKAKNNSTRVFLASAYALPFKDMSFDAVISIHMGYGFCESRLQMKTITAELYRVLKPEGLVLLDTPHSGTKGDHYITEWTAGEKVIKAVSYGKSKDEIKDVLNNTGFRQLDWYGFYDTGAIFKDDARRIIVTATK